MIRNLLLVLVVFVFSGCKHTDKRVATTSVEHVVSKPVTPPTPTEKKEAKSITIQILPINTLNIGLL